MSLWQIVLQLLSSSPVHLQGRKWSFPFRPLFDTQLFCPITRPQCSCFKRGTTHSCEPWLKRLLQQPTKLRKGVCRTPHNNERILLYYRKQHWSTFCPHHLAVKQENEGFFERSCFHYFIYPFFMFPQIFGSQACQIFQRGIITKDLDYNVSENEVAAIQQRALC